MVVTAAVRAEFSKAERTLEDTMRMSPDECTATTILERLYYACFHAARAAVYEAGKDPSRHAGVLALFGEHYVKDGPLERELGRDLSLMQTYREQAEYEAEEPNVILGDLKGKTSEFLDAVRPHALDP